MYYHLEQYLNDQWVSSGFVLYGALRDHLDLIQQLRIDTGLDFRMKRLIPREAVILQKAGMTLLRKRDDV